MQKKSLYFFASVLILAVLLLSGCEGLFSGFSTVYEPQPVHVRYDISYGYIVNCSGTGRYEITYLCDTPEVLRGPVRYSMLYQDEYETKTMGSNTFVAWNVSGADEQTYELGLLAHVESLNYVVADLNGDSAETVLQLTFNNPEVVAAYTHVQANETTRFIDPDDPAIQQIAGGVVQAAGTNNSFLLAKALFSWLKTNVRYETHPGEGGVRPASVTLEMHAGDCDDLSFLYVSLCRAVGIPARFVRGYLLTPYDNGTVTATPHAWTEVFVGEDVGEDGWIPVETACVTTDVKTDIHQNFGVEDAFHLRLFVDDGSNESLALSLSGISYISYGLGRNIEPQAFATVTGYQVLESKKLVVTGDNQRSYE